MDDYPFPDADDPIPCTCPADLVARGGFQSTCPQHGVRRPTHRATTADAQDGA